MVEVVPRGMLIELSIEGLNEEEEEEMWLSCMRR
jgi:hypothetical protein